MQVIDHALNKRAAVLLFLIGAFSMTQIKLGAKIGISEAVCCLIGPFLFLKNLSVYRRDGVSLYFYFLIFWIFGALFSDYYNHSLFVQYLRGFTVPLTLFSVSVCVYHLLRKNPLNLKWVLIGIAVSSVISIFFFQRGVAGDLAAEGHAVEAVERVVGYKLFWANMVITWVGLPIVCWYRSVPSALMYLALIVISFVSLMSGGRALFATSVLSIFFIWLGGKSAQSIHDVQKKIPVVLIVMLCLAALLKGGYSYAATHGYLSEEETKKYQQQTTKGTDFLSLLMSGRGDFFIGLIAALEKPLTGQGTQALDLQGYEREFVSKYGTDEEVAQFLRKEVLGYLRVIKSHSHVICYWMWHGVAGLTFWIYVLCLVIQTVRKRLDFIPEWFGYLALTLPIFTWDYFFSPLSLRVSECVLYSSLLVLLRIENLRKRGHLWCG